MYHLAESDLKEMSNHAYEYYNRNFRKRCNYNENT